MHGKPYMLNMYKGANKSLCSPPLRDIDCHELAIPPNGVQEDTLNLLLTRCMARIKGMATVSQGHKPLDERIEHSQARLIKETSKIQIDRL